MKTITIAIFVFFGSAPIFTAAAQQCASVCGSMYGSPADNGIQGNCSVSPPLSGYNQGSFTDQWTWTFTESDSYTSTLSNSYDTQTPMGACIVWAGGSPSETDCDGTVTGYIEDYPSCADSSDYYQWNLYKANGMASVSGTTVTCSTGTASMDKFDYFEADWASCNSCPSADPGTCDEVCDGGGVPYDSCYWDGGCPEGYDGPNGDGCCCS